MRVRQSIIYFEETDCVALFNYKRECVSLETVCNIVRLGIKLTTSTSPSTTIENAVTNGYPLLDNRRQNLAFLSTTSTSPSTTIENANVYSLLDNQRQDLEFLWDDITTQVSVNNDK